MSRAAILDKPLGLHPQDGRVTVLFDQLYRWRLDGQQWRLFKVPEQEIMELKAAVAAMDAGEISVKYPELVRQAMEQTPADVQ